MVLQVSQVFLEIPEEMACLGHVVLLARKGSLEFVVLQVSLQAAPCIYCSRTFGTLFCNDIKWSAHGVLEQC